MMNPIHQLEYVNGRAWPALTSINHHGWILRLSDGYSRRANSIIACETSTDALIDSIRYCEAVYGTHHLPTRFRVTNASQPHHLEQILLDEGYVLETPSNVMTLPVSAAPDAPDPQFISLSQFEDQWLMDYMRMSGVNPALFDSHRGIVSKMVGRVCFGRVEDAAIGLAHQTGSFVGIYDVVVDPVRRRQGYGRRIMQSLMHWAAQQPDVEIIHLSVQSDNTSAIKLYENLGFSFQYEYRYYRQPGVYG